MTSERRAAIQTLGLTVSSLAAAVATGIGWIGQPIRMVHVITILGLGMTAGVTWAMAIAKFREARRAETESAERVG